MMSEFIKNIAITISKTLAIKAGLSVLRYWVLSTESCPLGFEQNRCRVRMFSQSLFLHSVLELDANAMITYMLSVIYYQEPQISMGI